MKYYKHRLLDIIRLNNDGVWTKWHLYGNNRLVKLENIYGRTEADLDRFWSEISATEAKVFIVAWSMG